MELEEETVAAVYDRRPGEDGGHRPPLQSTVDSIPVGPKPEEEAALLTPDRTSEQFYGQKPPAENIDVEPVAASLPPLEDLVKRIPAPTLELLEELFRAQFVTVKRVPRSALKS